jgi:hypothetical protein
MSRRGSWFPESTHVLLLKNSARAIFGYLTVTVDLAGKPPRLTIAFSSPNPELGANYDHVAVSLTEGKLLQHASSRAK